MHIQWRRNEFESGGPVRSESGRGAPIRREAPGKFYWSCPSTFLALKVQLVVLVSAFVMVSTVWSVSFLLFFYSRCPPCPDICKSGGRAPLCPMESAPLCVGTACPWALLYSTDGESRTRDLSTTSQGTIRNCYSIE